MPAVGGEHAQRHRSTDPQHSRTAGECCGDLPNNAGSENGARGSSILTDSQYESMSEGKVTSKHDGGGSCGRVPCS